MRKDIACLVAALNRFFNPSEPKNHLPSPAHSNKDNQNLSPCSELQKIMI